MRLSWPVRAIVALAQALLPRRIFLALVAPVVAEAAGRGWRGTLRALAAVSEQLLRYVLLVPRDWLAEADFVLRGWLRASLAPTQAAPATEVSMSLGDRMLSTENPAGRRRAIAGTVAIAVHAVAIVAAVVWSFAKVDELPAPPPGLSVVFHVPKPPLPPTPKAPRAKDTPPSRGKRAAAEAVAPVVAPQRRAETEAAPAKDEPDEPGETCTGADCAGDPEGKGPPGSGPGAPGGTGTDPAPAEPPIKFIPPTWRQPERIAGSDPAYTLEAKAARLDGSVRLKVCFDKEGAVTSAQVLQGMPMGMTEAAVRAVRGWRYRPYLVGGQAIRGCIATTFNFALR